VRKLLLDTNVLIWFCIEPKKINEDILEELKTSDQVFASVVSVWEVAIKFRKGKFDLSPVIFVDMLNELEIPIIGLDASQCINDGKIKLSHGDPFDSILLNIAATLDSKFVTSDNDIIISASAYVIDARV
jgi:PIN domain nuclease of toxin-antitoxin system